MNDLISREAAVDVTWNAESLTDACKELKALPSMPTNADEVKEQALACAVELLKLVSLISKGEKNE